MSVSYCWAYDLDGVLIDSRQAVREAYAAAGIIMPVDAWGKPWHSWLPGLVGNDMRRARRVHIRKNALYPIQLALLGKPLPLAENVRHELCHGRPTYLLTGASYQATRCALEILGLENMPILEVEASQGTKTAALSRLAVRYPHGTYVDDQDGVTVPEGWRFELWKA